MLTTTNITEAIDLAFLDRADIKAYIGNPGLQACRPWLPGLNRPANEGCTWMFDSRHPAARRAMRFWHPAARSCSARGSCGRAARRQHLSDSETRRWAMKGSLPTLKACTSALTLLC